MSKATDTQNLKEIIVTLVKAHARLALLLHLRMITPNTIPNSYTKALAHLTDAEHEVTLLLRHVESIPDGLSDP